MPAATNMKSLFEEISELVEGPRPRGPEPQLQDVERVLTDGYAAKLELEWECMQLSRTIGEVSSQLGIAGDAEAKMRELSALNERLAAADDHLAHLRRALAELQARRAELQPA